jgi:hypothetical protein
MIPRYARKEAAAIWSPQTRFKIMFEIEAHAADAMADLGVIPKEAARVIRETGRDAICDQSNGTGGNDQCGGIGTADHAARPSNRVAYDARDQPGSSFLPVARAVPFNIR